MKEKQDRLHLGQWLKDEGVSVRGLAKECGVSPSTISRFLAGITRFTPGTARLVHEATGGSVSYTALLYPQEGQR